MDCILPLKDCSRNGQVYFERELNGLFPESLSISSGEAAVLKLKYFSLPSVCWNVPLLLERALCRSRQRRISPAQADVHPASPQCLCIRGPSRQTSHRMRGTWCLPLIISCFYFTTARHADGPSPTLGTQSEGSWQQVLLRAFLTTTYNWSFNSGFTDREKDDRCVMFRILLYYQISDKIKLKWKAPHVYEHYTEAGCNLCRTQVFPPTLSPLSWASESKDGQKITLFSHFLLQTKTFLRSPYIECPT